MVAMHLLRQDARVVGALLVSPTPGLPHCLRQGIWPFPVRGVLALIACALSLCDVTDLEACSRSDLNRAWLLRGLEQRTLTAEALRLAEESSRPGPAAAAGLGVWLRRRLGDFAALSAVGAAWRRATAPHSDRRWGASVPPAAVAIALRPRPV
ncbi:unnamed protein product, partial [Prorocentrum cordatum]